MILLAIDTSTEQASVALGEGEIIRAEWSWTSGSNHSRHLHGLLENLLQVEALSPADLTHIAVASGPGSFNGIRVGMSAAKGLAVALGIPLVGISTLDVIAFAARCLSEEVWAGVTSGRDRAALAQYRGRGPDWHRTSDYILLPLREAAEAVPSGALVAGSAAGKIVASMEALGKEARTVPPAMRLRRAGYLAELGRRYFQGGGEDQVEQLEPLYLRRSAAEEKRAAAEGS